MPFALHSPCSAGGWCLQPYSISLHIPPALVFSHQPGNNVFLSHHSSSSPQLQPAELSDCGTAPQVVLSTVPWHRRGRGPRRRQKSSTQRIEVNSFLLPTKVMSLSSAMAIDGLAVSKPGPPALKFSERQQPVQSSPGCWCPGPGLAPVILVSLSLDAAS